MKILSETVTDTPPRHMKHEHLEVICKRINDFAKLEKDKYLVPTEGMASVCEDDDGVGHISVGLVGWKEPNLLTQKGRDERQQNDAALSRIRAFAETLGSLEWDGMGTGEWGSFACYKFTPNRAASRD